MNHSHSRPVFQLIVLLLISAKFLAGCSLKTDSDFVGYDEVFGGENVAPGVVFNFSDFRLRFKYHRELNADELRRKDAAIKSGVSGGDAMIWPFYVFEVLSLTGQVIEKFELSTLPHAWQKFSVNGVEYTIRIRSPGWIVQTECQAWPNTEKCGGTLKG
jgi:hypothetical protein